MPSVNHLNLPFWIKKLQLNWCLFLWIVVILTCMHKFKYCKMFCSYIYIEIKDKIQKNSALSKIFRILKWICKQKLKTFKTTNLINVFFYYFSYSSIYNWSTLKIDVKYTFPKYYDHNSNLNKNKNRLYTTIFDIIIFGILKVSYWVYF